MCAVLCYAFFLRLSTAAFFSLSHTYAYDTAPTMFRPTSASAPFSNLYYSLQLPGMLTYISLTSYAPGQTFSTQEEQYVWLEAELQKVGGVER